MGWPFTDITAFVQRAAWINTVPDKFKDVWFCTSLQSTEGINRRGKPKAVRKAANALKQKSIWIDVDIKPNDPKHYGDEKEALKAIFAFQLKVGLPPPSAIVQSGGGLHIYWISREALDPADWALYAGGLKQLLLGNAIKCDSGLTTDIARILRVPGTFNYKYDPPRAVTLLPQTLVMYDFPIALAALPPLAPVTKPPPAAETNASFVCGQRDHRRLRERTSVENQRARPRRRHQKAHLLRARP